MQPTLQDNQRMSKRRVLGFKPHLRLEWRGQDGQSETEQPDHSASLGDSITSSTQIRFSVHTGGIVALVRSRLASPVQHSPDEHAARRGLVLPISGIAADEASSRCASVAHYERMFRHLLDVGANDRSMLHEEDGFDDARRGILICLAEYVRRSHNKPKLVVHAGFHQS